LINLRPKSIKYFGEYMPQWNSKQWGIVISLTIFLVTMILLLAGPCIIAIIRMIGG